MAGIQDFVGKMWEVTLTEPDHAPTVILSRDDPIEFYEDGGDVGMETTGGFFNSPLNSVALQLRGSSLGGSFMADRQRHSVIVEYKGIAEERHVQERKATEVGKEMIMLTLTHSKTRASSGSRRNLHITGYYHAQH